MNMKIPIFILIFIAGSFSFAEESILPLDKPVGLVDELLTDGIESIGGLNLHALKQEMATIEYNYVKGDLPDFAGERDSGYYTVPGQVYLRESYPKDHDSALELLTVHEALGALNFKDEDYGLSIILKLLSDKSPDQRGKMLEHLTIQFMFPEKPEMYMNGTGGATGVGGGGDLMAAWVKYRVTQEFLRHQHTTFSAFYMTQIKFEPFSKNIRSNIDSNIQALVQPYSREPHQGILGYIQLQFEKNPDFTHNKGINFKVIVPTKYLEKNPKSIEPVVQEITKFVRAFAQGIEFAKIFDEGKNPEFQFVAQCGFVLLSVPKELLEDELLKRSGGISPFIENFKKDCKNDFDFPTKIL